MIVYFDGGSRGNPGPSAGACVIISDVKEITVGKSVWLGRATNNQAEYSGLSLAMRSLFLGDRLYDGTDLIIRGDSALVINQMNGTWQIKNPVLRSLHSGVMEVLDAAAKTYRLSVQFEHIPRELNTMADGLVNACLDGHKGWTFPN